MQIYSRTDLFQDTNQNVCLLFFSSPAINLNYFLPSTEHIKNDHKAKPTQAQKLFKCSECEFTDFTNENVVDHIQNVHRKQYKCDSCDFSTPNITILANHTQEIHENFDNTENQSEVIEGKSYECSVCDFVTSIKSEVLKHMKEKHQIENERKKSAESHIIQNTNKKNVPAHQDKKPHKCPYCENTYAYAKGVKDHIRSFHEGYR